MENARRADVAVIVVTYNSADVLGELLESLPRALAGCTSTVTVVDNDSHDSIAELVQGSGAQLISMGYNAGYAAAINAGMSPARPARSVLILNPDIRLEPGAVAVMLDCMRRRGAGIVVPRLVDGDGQLIYSLRREPNVRRSLGDTLLGTRRAGHSHMWGEVFIRPEHYRHETVADWATGAAMLVSDRCVAACGRWDESFFLYSEETEYCLRARDQGFELVLCPAVTAVHLGGESKVSPRLRTLLVVNRLRLYARARSRAATTMFWLVAVAREASRTLRGRPASREVLVALLSRRRMRCARQAVSGSSGTLTTGRSDAVG